MICSKTVRPSCQGVRPPSFQKDLAAAEGGFVITCTTLKRVLKIAIGPLLPRFPVRRGDGSAQRSRAPAASSPSLPAPRPTTPADSDAATQTPDWHSLRAPAPPLPPTRLLATSPRRYFASPPPNPNTSGFRMVRFLKRVCGRRVS
jgi:hypothetical protein